MHVRLSIVLIPAILVLLIALGLLVVPLVDSDAEHSDELRATPADPPVAETVAAVVTPPEEPGSTLDPAVTEASAAEEAGAQGVEVQDDLPVSSYGTLPIVRADTHPALALAAEAVREGSHPERISAFHHGEPYDPSASAEERAAWVATPEPGRVFRPAQPGAEVPAISIVGNGAVEMEQGATVTLAVRVPAGAPVTFTSFDNGWFPNKLTTITVLADAEGIARTEFHAPSGVAYDAGILAASPLASGRATFSIAIAPPPLARRP